MRRARPHGTGARFALEDLIAETFSMVPGLEVRARSAKSVFQNEELDLVMTSRGVGELSAFGPYFSAECKNWSRPVGSTELSWFATKLRRSGQRFGVLVAANGVTGRSQELTASHFEVAAALTEGQSVVVLTLAELGWMDSGEALADLLVEKHARLVAHREIYIQDTPARHSPLSGPPRLPPVDSMRREILRAMSLAVETNHDRVRSLDVTLDAYRAALDAFLLSESREGETEDQDVWIETNMIAFEQLERSIERVGEACIATLRGRKFALDWSVEYLELGLEVQAPRNVDAPPDSPLAELLLGHWVHVLREGPPHKYNPALLCILGWAIEWRIAIGEGRWPPEMI